MTATDEAVIADVIVKAVRTATATLVAEQAALMVRLLTLDDALRASQAEVEALRRELAALDAKALSYEGVYTPGTLYRKNALVTRGGSMWLCLVESTLSIPGHESSQWKLTVKEGSG